MDAVDLPVTADLDDGYDDPAETIRRAIGLGIVGANVEDRLRPFDESVARVAAIIAAAEAEGVNFQLNARTDAIARGGERPISESIDDAIARGRAFLDAGAALVFVPGAVSREVVEPSSKALASASCPSSGCPARSPPLSSRSSASPASPTARSRSASPFVHSATSRPTCTATE